MKYISFILLVALLLCAPAFFLSCKGSEASTGTAQTSTAETVSEAPAQTACDTAAASASSETAAFTSASTTTTTTTGLSDLLGSEFDGIDISRWQGNVDFEAVRLSGIQALYIKAGDSFNCDKYFEQNAKGAENAGLYIGFYFYVTASSTDEAALQAEFFADLIDDYDYDLRPAVDFEAFGNLSNEQINSIALAFARRVEEETGIRPIFYTDADNADIWCDELTEYPLWIADYDADPPANIGKWEKYAAFQYSNTGNVEGITENVVDLDVFTDDILFK